MTTAQSFPRRHFLARAVAVATGAGAFSLPAFAEWRPQRPITLLSPLPAGGALDAQLRLLAQRVGVTLGQPLIVDAKPGAGTTLAGALVANAKADGHTLAITLVNSLRYPHYQKTQWDPLKDFDYICGLGSFSLGVIVRADAPWKTLEDLVQEGKRTPGRLSYGTAGIGGSGNLIVLDLERATGARFTHIPYKGGPETQRALQAGELDFIVEGGNQLALAETGVLRALAITSSVRSNRLPNVPTFKERGIEVAGPSTYGLVGPARLTRDAIDALANAFLHATADPAFATLLDTQYAERWPLRPAEYRAWAEKYFINIEPLLRRAGLSKQ
jgi:tripartite-type tricarboxylate transporter receptor subunit TctC